MMFSKRIAVAAGVCRTNARGYAASLANDTRLDFGNETFNLTVNGSFGPDYIAPASSELVNGAGLFTNYLPQSQ
jgi:hypothetical protein